LGSRHDEATVCWNLGVQYLRKGDLSAATTFLDEAVAFEREIGHASAERDAAYVAEIRRSMN
jgi:Tfp pilus assembly protein PilF